MNELDEVTYKGLIVCILGNIHSPRQLSLIYRSPNHCIAMSEKDEREAWGTPCRPLFYLWVFFGMFLQQ